MIYRVQYTDRALDSLRKMNPQRRARFDQEMQRVARDPHAFGSPIGGTGNSKRTAVIAGALTDYWISSPGVLTVSVVSIVHTD
ncbi:type II toxin-antitoxin system RelE/ParE family toxin [Streptomyces sp. NPDC057638]|uniref:type II toxin-antitoxin system RelE family toxin n=1 Tax=Streptomyces sp. NPDC057638 TaxID=3346190 RepID=UPI0036C6BB0D